jgi:hypothetical protein
MCTQACLTDPCGQQETNVRQPSYSRTLFPSQPSTGRSLLKVMYTNCYQFTDPWTMNGLVDCARPGVWTRVRQTRGAVKNDGARSDPFSHAGLSISFFRTGRMMRRFTVPGITVSRSDVLPISLMVLYNRQLCAKNTNNYALNSARCFLLPMHTVYQPQLIGLHLVHL